MTQEVYVTGMTCQGCANSVKTKLSQINGVEAVEIDLENKKAVLSSDQEISQDVLQTALADTNYSIA